MERELIPVGEFQGVLAVVLDGGAVGSAGPDWMMVAAGASQGPFLLRRIAFPGADVALERLASSRAEAPFVWRSAALGEGWPSSGVWTALDLTDLVRSAGLDSAATRAALAELPPMGSADEVLVRTTSVAASALDEMYAWLDPRHAWLVVSAEDVPAATRLASKALTPWGVRAG